MQAATLPQEQHNHYLSESTLGSQTAVAVLLFCLGPLTCTATGILAAGLAARRGKSWRWGFALGFLFSTAGVMLVALPPGCSLPNFCNPKCQNAIRNFVHSLSLCISEACRSGKRQSL